MTKVIILGEQPQEEKKLKSIEFVKAIFTSQNFDPNKLPSDFQNIELVCFNYLQSGNDLMFCFDDLRSHGILHLGHFNDGVVE